jgi:hypothetical protein
MKEMHDMDIHQLLVVVDARHTRQLVDQSDNVDDVVDDDDDYSKKLHLQTCQNAVAALTEKRCVQEKKIKKYPVDDVVVVSAVVAVYRHE